VQEIEDVSRVLKVLQKLDFSSRRWGFAPVVTAQSAFYFPTGTVRQSRDLRMNKFSNGPGRTGPLMW